MGTCIATNFNYAFTKYDIDQLACFKIGNCQHQLPLTCKISLCKRKPKQSYHMATSMEINNNYFVIERSLDGKDFNEIGKVAGSGTSTSLATYSFTDHDANREDAYYRIKQVDYNEISAT